MSSLQQTTSLTLWWLTDGRTNATYVSLTRETCTSITAVKSYLYVLRSFGCAMHWHWPAPFLEKQTWELYRSGGRCVALVVPCVVRRYLGSRECTLITEHMFFC